MKVVKIAKEKYGGRFKERAMPLISNSTAFQKSFANLPIASLQAGETVSCRGRGPAG